jgi:hypothetical protein
MDHTVLTAWREGIAEASKNPDLNHELQQRERELLPRFAEHYGKLRALPRRMRRGLQRQCRKSLAAIALLLALGAAPALAATINVGGTCTLGRAITSANNNASRFCTPGSGADTIVLPANSTQTLTAVNNNVYGPTGLPIIRSTITIAGNNSTIRRGANAPPFRVLAVGNTGNLTLRRATVSGGRLPAVAGDGYYVAEYGSGVLNFGNGRLTLTNSTVSGNSGSGVGNFDPGIYTPNSVNVLNSTVSGNGGAGLANYSGQITITKGTISSNDDGIMSNGAFGPYGGSIVIGNTTISGNEGSGISSSYTSITLNTSTISRNAGTGVAIGDYGGATITNSTISANTGIGLLNGYFGVVTLTNSTISGNGAGIDSDARGRVTLTNSTISGNRGAALFNGTRSRATLTNSTVTGNSGGGVINDYDNVTLVRTLVAGNGAGPEISNDAGGTITASNFNLFGHSGLTNAQAFENFTPGATDISSTSNGTAPKALNAILNTTLANNGGPTRTHALVSGSPAIDAVTNVNTCPPPAKDQRGIARPQDGNGDGGVACDIGSFERRP